MILVMNRIFILAARLHSLPPLSWRNVVLRALPMLPAVLLVLSLAGCGGRDAVQVQVTAQPIPGEHATVLQVEAQVAGPLTGLRYKWFSLAGECDPQESNEPKTTFRFAEGTKQDRVSVEVWRDNVRVAQNDVRVKFDQARASMETRTSSGVQILITDTPPAEPGGMNTRSHISGKIRGKFPADSLVVIYAHCSGFWVVQPIAQSMHTLHTGNTWGTWTHTGTRYAVLLVRPNYEPLSKVEMLPETNDVVLACTVVDGVLQKSGHTTDLNGTNAP
jgi:hypothetical protein